MTALEELKKFCLEKGITLSLIENTPKKDKNAIVTIPGISLIVQYKK